MRLEPTIKTLRFWNYKNKITKKIKRFLRFHWLDKGLKNQDKEFRRECKTFCQNQLKSLGKPDWHFGYAAANGISSRDYIPEDFFYLYFEPKINRYELDQAYTNKAFLNKFFKNVTMPHSYVIRAGGYFYDNFWNSIEKSVALEIIMNLLNKGDKLILKTAINARGGKSVVLLTRENSNELEKHFQRTDFVIQKYIQQHPALSILNPKSLNTVRIMTLRNRVSTEVLPLSAIVRMGRANMFVDNQSSGGISSGLHDDGRLKPRAFDGFFLAFDEVHPDHGFRFADQKVPVFSKIINLVKDLHLQMPYFRLISWDIAVDPEENLHLVEFNTKYQEINFHQLNNGPLFGENTDEILEDFFQSYIN